MAFKMNVKMNNGITVNDAYVKIFNAGTDKNWANITVAYYVNKDMEESFYQHAYVFRANMQDGAENLWKQGYEHLKTLPEFADAEDTLEDGQHA